ncbi:redox-regulated ATPase YchF [bacterium]|nr:redox-regulated ATPase YchF [bacterium]
MSLSIGIVGLPNVGKSTLFRALTKKQVDVSNYPFCTIDPSVGVVAVPDPRLGKLAALNKSVKKIPGTVEFVDIAGLVKGAAKGEGLGNKFLSHIREVDAIAHVVRGFNDDNIIHVEGKVDAEADKSTIELELILADLETVTKHFDKLTKLVRGHDKISAKKLPVVEKIKITLENEKLAGTLQFDEEELELIKELNLLTLKPVIQVLNVDEEDAAKSHEDYIAISAKIEAEIAELSSEEQKSYLTDLGLTEAGLDRLAREGYKTLDLITFFTSGPEETRAWEIPRGTTAPGAAGVIHTDFEEKFIKAEVIGYDDYIGAGSENAAKEAGKMHLEGKEYIVQDGDVIFFHHG